MRRIKSSFNDPFSLGCICLYLASAINGYILRVDQSNDLEETKAFDDGRVPHKRTFGGIEEGFEEDVDGGAAGGDVGHSDGGSGRYVSFAEAPPKFIEARKHGKVLLECSAKGEPAPQIRWYKDGKPLHKVINNQPSQRYFETTFFMVGPDLKCATRNNKLFSHFRTKSIQRKCSTTMECLFTGTEKVCSTKTSRWPDLSVKSKPRSTWTVLQKKMQASMSV